jgi:hypothetical protein
LATNPASGTAGRFRSLAAIAIFDVGAPLALYSVLRSAGQSTVTALLLSGVFPLLHTLFGIIRHRRLDVVGALVIAGIAVGAIFALFSHSAKPVLAEGSVPTAVFGACCLISLWTRRPLMYGFALQFIGADTPRGREMTMLWQYEGFRHVFRLITAVWGIAFLLEAAVRVIVVFNTSTRTALITSGATPFIWVGVLCAWTFTYGTVKRKQGERMPAVQAAQAAAAEPTAK